jgi:hypothetical protein
MSRPRLADPMPAHSRCANPGSGEFGVDSREIVCYALVVGVSDQTVLVMAPIAEVNSRDACTDTERAILLL